jgi:hypothetical protein
MRDLPGIFSLIFPLLLAGTVIPATGYSSELDPISSDCLSCHNGTSGPHVRYCLLEQKGTGCGGHIVSVSYAEMAAKDENLLPLSKLPPQLSLLDGKITCVTCHGTEAHNGIRLIIDNQGSALCRSCHLK